MSGSTRGGISFSSRMGVRGRGARTFFFPVGYTNDINKPSLHHFDPWGETNEKNVLKIFLYGCIWTGSHTVTLSVLRYVLKSLRHLILSMSTNSSVGLYRSSHLQLSDGYTESQIFI